MTAPRRVETVLFDVDGTLIDSNGAHAEAWTQALGEHGVVVDVAEIRRLIGMGGDKLLPAVAHVDEDSAPGRAIVRRKKAIFATLLPDLQPTPGARALLEYLREQRVNLCRSRSPRGHRGDRAALRRLLVRQRAARRTRDLRRSGGAARALARTTAPGQCGPGLVALSMSRPPPNARPPRPPAAD